MPRPFIPLAKLDPAVAVFGEIDPGLVRNHKVELSSSTAFIVGNAGSGTTPPIYPAGSFQPAPAYSGTFIPEIWSGKLIEKFYAATVLAAISNTAYEGEISGQGDKVHIRTKPTIAIRDYLVGGDLSVDRPASNIVDLSIDKAKYFNTILDDIMKVQSDINLMSIWSDDAAQQMKIIIDTDVLAGIINQSSALNRGLTAGAISAVINLGATVTTPLTVVPNLASPPVAGTVTILEVMMRLGQALDEQNIPEDGRWIVMPAWASAMVKKSELRQAYLSGDSVSMLRNGQLGMVDRFMVYTSNLLPHGTAVGLAASEWVIYAGHAHGLTFASQMTNVETLRSERTFGQLFRGLQVYGYKVIDGKALAQAIVIPG
jgi:hypothetical protein